MFQIQQNVTADLAKVVVNRISDVRGGVSIDNTALVAGKYVLEGTPLTAPVNGKRKPCKQAILLDGSTTTSAVVDSVTNQFKVGDFVAVKTGGKAYAITAITTADGKDTMTIGTAIDAVNVGDIIFQAAAQSATTTSAVLNVPDVILKNHYKVPVIGTTVMDLAGAFVRADVYAGYIHEAYLATCKGILEIKY